MPAKRPNIHIEVIDSYLEINLMFDENNMDKFQIGFNESELYHISIVGQEAIPDEDLKLNKRNKFFDIDYEYDEEANRIIKNKPSWKFINITEEDNKENNLSLKTIQKSISDITFSFANYADFNLDKHKHNYTYLWDNMASVPKPDIENGLHSVIVEDEEGNRKEYKDIKFPEYTNSLNQLPQLRKLKKVIEERISNLSHIKIIRDNLPNGEYKILITCREFGEQHSEIFKIDKSNV